MKKIDRRSFLKIAGAAAGAAALTACGSSASSTAASTAASSTAASTAASDAAVTLVYNEVNSDASLAGQVAAKLAEQANTLSNGSITIDTRCGGSLFGSEPDCIDDMTGGAPTVDIARISIFNLDSYGVPTTRATNMPYAFQSREHFWKFAESDIGTQIKTDPQAVLGISGKCYYEEGFRHFFCAKALNSVEDMKGLNVRVSTSAVYQDLVSSLGANPVDISFSELYSSLGGACDAAEQPIANYQSNSFYEVAPNMILDGHMMGAGMIVMTDAAWDKLSADQQTALQAAFDAAAAYDQEISVSAEDEAKTACEAAGATFVEVADKTPWIEATASVIEKNCTEAEVKATYDAIVALA